MQYFFFFLKEVRNATEAHTALMRDSPCVPRTPQMQFKRMNILKITITNRKLSTEKFKNPSIILPALSTKMTKIIIKNSTKKT